jgi:hypothetical protein
MQSDSDYGAARAALRGQILRAIVPLAMVVALCGAWSATAPLAGAVVALRQLKVELNRKTVQPHALRSRGPRQGQWHDVRCRRTPYGRHGDLHRD